MTPARRSACAAPACASARYGRDAGARDPLWRQQSGQQLRQPGVRDGAEALQLARAAGQPPGSAIYFALGGAAGYRVGGHGSHAWCLSLVDRGLGAELRLSPVLGQPGRDPGLFRLAGHGAALGVGRR